MSDLAIPDTSTWDIDALDGGARRPTDEDLGLDDFGNTQLIDDDRPGMSPPKGGTQLFAALCGQWQMQLNALGRIAPLCIVIVDFTGGTPFVDRIICPSTTMVSGDWLAIDNGTGDTTLKVENTKIPAVVDARAANDTNTDTTAGATIVPSPPAGFFEVRVTTFTAGSAADKRVSVALY